MVKHIIIWNFKEELSESERSEAASKIKEGLEGLKGKIDGLEDIKVNTLPLESSNGDIMLDSTFSDEDALKGYQVNPLHIEVATYVCSKVGARKCFDYKV